MSDFAIRKEPVESAVVELSENNVAIFRANGLPGAAQGDKVTLLAALSRQRKVVAARAQIANEQVEITLEQFVTLYIAEPTFSKDVPDLQNIVVGDLSLVSGEAAKEAQAAADAAKEAAKQPMSTPKRSPGLLRGIALARQRKSPMPPPAVASIAETKKEKAAAWAASREVDTDLAAVLKEAGLSSLERGLGLAQIIHLREFRMHSIADLEESMKRSTVLGSKGKLSNFERKRLVAIGLEVGDDSPDVPKLPALKEKAEADLADGAEGDEENCLAEGLALLEQTNVNDKGKVKVETIKALGTWFASDLFTDAPRAQELLGRVPDSEMQESKLMAMTNSLASVLGLSSMQVDSTADLGDLIDALDILLTQAVETGTLTKIGIRPDGTGMRAVTKHMSMMKLALSSGQATTNDKVESGASVGSTDSLTDSMLAKLVAVSSGSQRLTDKEEKVAEELAASAARLEKLSNDKEAMMVLATLAKVAESDVGDEMVMSSYAAAMNANVRVAELLKSSQVKTPRGDEVLTNHHSSECVTLIRAARNGVVRAAKALMRRLLTSGADVAALVEAAWSGDFRSSSGVDVAALGKPSAAKTWLDVPVCTVAGAAQKSHMLTTLLIAQPAIAQIMTMLQPCDKSIPMVLAEAFSSMAKGVRSTSVADAVDCILVPLMRAYHEAWVLFQKSSSMPMPNMLTVWTKEKMEPATVSFLTRTGSVSAGATAGTSENGAEISELKRTLQSLKIKVERNGRTTQPAAGPTLKSINDKSDDELTPTELAKRVSNREKRALRLKKGSGEEE